MSVHPAQLILGSYRLLDKIGEGGMGAVYRGWHTQLKRPVAIKLLRSTSAEDSAAIARFRREMEAIGRLNHPNVVRATDAGQVDGIHYLVMDYYEGIDLARLLAQGALRTSDACELARQAAVGLDYISQHGLVHRDIKPSNLLLTSEGVVKILDLGLARFFARTDVAEVTSIGEPVGTVDYMAPEQVTGSREIDIRADIYSLGCTLYALLAGRPPFSGPSYDTVAKKLRAHCTELPPPLDEVVPDVPLLLSDIVTMMLAKAPRARIRHPREVIEALAPFCENADLLSLASRALAQQPTRACAVLSDMETPMESAALSDTAPASSSKLAQENPAARRSASWWQPRKTTLAITSLAMAGAVLLAIAAAWRSLSPGKGVELPRDTTIREKLPDSTTERTWLAALGKLPQELIWPGHNGKGSFQFDDQLRALVITVDQPRFIELGTLGPDVAAVSVDIEQPVWTGRCGLFFGYRDDDDRNNRGGVKMQLVGLEYLPMPEKKVFAIYRRSARVLQQFRSLDMTFESRVDLSGGVRGQVHRLRIELDAGRITRLSWDENPLEELSIPHIDKKFTNADCSGVWGVYCLQGTTWFSNPQVIRKGESHE